MRRESPTSVRVSYPKLNRRELIERITAGVERLQKNLPLHRVALFGSYASGRFTAGSDIDLLIVYEGEARSDVYGLVVKNFRLPRLEPHCYPKAEYEYLLRNNRNFAKMLKDSLQIHPK